MFWIGGLGCHWHIARDNPFQSHLRSNLGNEIDNDWQLESGLCGRLPVGLPNSCGEVAFQNLLRSMTATAKWAVGLDGMQWECLGMLCFHGPKLCGLELDAMLFSKASESFWIRTSVVFVQNRCWFGDFFVAEMPIPTCSCTWLTMGKTSLPVRHSKQALQ